jgi:hypothetical protein
VKDLRNRHIQFMADMLLIDRVLNTIAKQDQNGAIVKQAFDLKSTVSDMMNSIKTSVESQIDPNDKVKTVLHFLLPGVLFRLHPGLWALSLIGRALGFDVSAALSHMATYISDKIKAGIPVSHQDVEQAGKEAASSMGVTASEDLFYGLRDLERNGDLKKLAANPGIIGGALKAWKGVPWLGRGLPPLQRMFTFLAPTAAKNLIVGILIMAVKTVLLSGGLIAGVGLLAHVLHSDTKTENATNTPETTQNQSSQMPGNLSTNVPPQASPGSYNFRTHPGDSWVVELRDKKTGEIIGPDELIFDWAVRSYPEIEEYEALVMNNHMFQNAVGAVSRNWLQGTPWLTIPEEFSTPNDILGIFMQDVMKDIDAVEKESNSANKGAKTP